MATKRYNEEYKEVELANGNGMTVYCYTTDTRQGFCHHAECYFNGREYKARVSYLNRTWESFRYETTLKYFIEKFPKAMRSELTEILVERKSKEEHEKAERLVARFTDLHNKLTDKQKKSLENVEMHTESDANAVMGIMGMMALMGE